MRILHFSDVHARDSQIDEIGKCLGEIVQVAADEEPDLIVMAGDTFDSRMVRLDSQAAKLIFNIYGELADIAPMVVITGTPSHDGLTVQVMEHVRAENPIHVADYPEQIILTDSGIFAPVHMPLVKGGNAKALISLVPTPTKQYWEKFGGEGKSGKETDQEVAQALSVMLADFGAVAADFGVPHILVGHFSVGGAYLSESQQLIGQDIELSKDQIGYAEADLVCLGHIHLRQQIGTNIYYSGSIHRKDWGELEEKGFYVHEINDNGLTSTFHKTPTRKLAKVKFDMTNGHPPMEKIAEGLDVTGAFVRIELKIYQDEVDALDAQRIRDLFSDAQDVDLRIQPVPRETVRAATLLELQRLRDKIKEMALLREEEVPESILAKADMLETMEVSELEKAVGHAG